MTRWAIRSCLLLLVAAASGCEVVDKVRERARGGGGEETASGGGMMLGLQVPGTLSAGQEGSVRLSLTNRGDSVPRNLRLDLLVPGWMELAPPRPGDREVTMAPSDGEGTRFSYRLDEPPLGPGETQIIEQRVRVPRDIPGAAGGRPWGRLIRARLVNARGQALAEVQSEVALDSVMLRSPVFAARDTVEEAPRDQLGPARLGMTAAQLKQAAAGARDTSWSQEGTTERGVVVPVPGGGRALAVLAGDSVMRIEVRDSVARTREGLGVGSTLEQLRAAYGRACAGIGEGLVAVWFPAAPGISYALDVPFVGNVTELATNPERLPGTARVTRWWLRRGTDSCQ
jgi:hypothetical protein